LEGSQVSQVVDRLSSHPAPKSPIILSPPRNNCFGWLVGWLVYCITLTGEYNTGQVQTRGMQGSYLASAVWYICVTAQGGPGRTGKNAHTNTQCNIAAIYYHTERL
jgi:hypothetical protein